MRLSERDMSRSISNLMAARSNSHISAAAVACCAGLAGGLAHAQTDHFFTNINGEWNVAGNWNAGTVPAAIDNSWVDGGRVARMSANYTARTADLNIGWGGSGLFVQQQGMMIAAGTAYMGHIAAGGTGSYELVGPARFQSNNLVVGRVSNGNFNMTPGYTGDVWVAQDTTVGGWGGTGTGLITQQGGQFGTGRDLTIGHDAGSSGTFDLRSGVAFTVRNVYVGWNGQGLLKVANGTNFGVGETMYIGRHGAAGPLRGDVNVNGGRIYSYYTNSPGQVVVRGSNARMYGSGTYDVKVRFESDQLFGNSAKSVAVGFEPGVLTMSSKFNVAAGLTARSGPAAAQTALTSRALTGTATNVSWGDATLGNSANYNNVLTTPDRHMRVEVPYKAADITAGGGVTGAGIAGRIRLMQVGARRWNAATVEQSNTTGQIRNITSEVQADRVVGKTPDVYGEWDTAIVGKAVNARHQDPAFRQLHAMGLDGSGVLMGQLELGVPDFAHGAFEDWNSVNGVRASVLGAAPTPAQIDPHANRVASIMVGNDPLGIQVDQQGRLASTGYGPGGSADGFKGAAPNAKLRSRIWTTGTGSAADVTAFAGVNDPTHGAMKIVNMSAGALQSLGAPAPQGTTVFERAIDRLVEQSGIIWTQAAGNDGQALASTYGSLVIPAGSYNSIVVGNAVFDDAAGGLTQPYPTNFDIDHAAIRLSSSRGATADGRARPDLVAQGVGNLSAFSYESAGRDPVFPLGDARGLYSTQKRTSDTSAPRPESGTSFAAPTVAGVAALMVQKARSMPIGAGPAESPMIIKSVMQTSADKPANWSKGTTAAGDDTTANPLSYDWGAGLVDPVGAVTLLGEGPAPNPLYITKNGWSFTNMQTDDSIPYNIRKPDGTAGAVQGDAFMLTDVLDDTSLTMTLNWFSHVDATNARSALTSMFVQLYSLEAGVWEPIPGIEFRSDSAIDNLQHIYVPQMPVGGNILARVFLNGALSPAAGPAETYGLSWEYSAVPAPSVLALMGLGAIIAGRRRR